MTPRTRLVSVSWVQFLSGHRLDVKALAERVHARGALLCVDAIQGLGALDPETGRVHHGGNFQAMSVTMAMENLRLALVHIGKILFSQSTELLNPTMNNGLAGNLASTDPSLNFFGKGLDIAMASYVGELCFLGNPVSTGVQSAEMHNQAVK